MSMSKYQVLAALGVAVPVVLQGCQENDDGNNGGGGGSGNQAKTSCCTVIQQPDPAAEESAAEESAAEPEMLNVLACGYGIDILANPFDLTNPLTECEDLDSADIYASMEKAVGSLTEDEINEVDVIFIGDTSPYMAGDGVQTSSETPEEALIDLSGAALYQQNLFTYIRDTFKDGSVKVIDMHATKLDKVPSGTLGRWLPPSVQVLQLGENELTEFTLVGSEDHQLAFLDLHDNKLESMTLTGFPLMPDEQPVEPAEDAPGAAEDEPPADSQDPHAFASINLSKNSIPSLAALKFGGSVVLSLDVSDQGMTEDEYPVPVFDACDIFDFSDAEPYLYLPPTLINFDMCDNGETDEKCRFDVEQQEDLETFVGEVSVQCEIVPPACCQIVNNDSIECGGSLCEDESGDAAKVLESLAPLLAQLVSTEPPLANLGVADITNLEIRADLSLEHNSANEWEALNGLAATIALFTGLESIDMSQCKLDELAPLAFPTSVKSLDLSQNNFADFDAVLTLLEARAYSGIALDVSDNYGFNPCTVIDNATMQAEINTLAAINICYIPLDGELGYTCRAEKGAFADMLRSVRESARCNPSA